MIKLIKKHYHWIIAVVLFLIMAIRGGAGNNLSGLHLIPVTESLGITRAEYSLAAMPCAIIGMLSTMVSGALILKFGYRSLLTVFLVILAAAYALMGSAQNYPTFILGYTLMGTAAGICGDAGATRVVSTWFHKHRGAVLGVITSATGVGGSIMCIFQSAAIEAKGYRASYFLVAILMIVCAVMALVFVRSHPSKMGLLPYGDGEKIPHKKREHETDHWHGMDMKHLVRRPTFYMMLFGTLICCIIPYLAFSVVIPHLQDKGLSATEASSLQSLLLLFLTGAKILAGFLCDSIGARKVTLLCMGCCAAALVLLSVTSGMATSAAILVLYALGLPLVSITIPLLSASLFGYQAQAQYTGLFISMVSAASMMAGPITNAIYDAVGTYDYTFRIGAGLMVLLMLFYLLMYRLADKDREKLEAAEAVAQS